MKKPVYTLTGNTTNPAMAIDLILGRYFKSVRSASTLVPSENRSLMYDINTGTGASGKQGKILDSINYLFDPVFDSHNVTVEVKAVNSAYEITVKVVVQDNGSTVNVSTLVNASDTQMGRITKISEKGNSQ